MFEALIITLREGVEAALILGIAIAFLRRRGQDRAIPVLLGGAAAALAASFVVAGLATRVQWNEELAEGIAMLVGAVLVGSLVAWMWKAGPHLKREIEHGLERAAGPTAGETAAAPRASSATGAGVFLFAFGMLFREGAETALFLAASGFNSQGVGRVLGALLGLALAAAFGVLFVRGTLRIPLKPFFSLTSAVLLLIALQLLVGGLHELSEAMVIPASRAEMAIVGPFVKNELLLFTLTVALAAGWLLARPRAPDEGVAPEAPMTPEARLMLAARRRENTWRRAIALVGLAVVAFLGTAFVLQSQVPERPPAEPAPAEAGVASIDASRAGDGRLHFYETPTPDGPVRWFVVGVGGELRACADACEICGDKGYYESGSSIVCRNCTAPIARGTLGRTGGCNPIPLAHRVEAGRLSVSESDLRALVQRRGGR